MDTVRVSLDIVSSSFDRVHMTFNEILIAIGSVPSTLNAVLFSIKYISVAKVAMAITN